MADDKKVGYPRIARSVWFGLRDKLKTRVPAEISPTYVAGIFGMEPASAASNVIPALRAFGLIDENNKPLDLAWDWRDDAKYSEVCEKIIEQVYPQELRDLYHSPDSPLEGVKNWFMRSARVGEAAAIKYAITYLTLVEADLAKASTGSQKAKSNNAAPPKAKPAKAAKDRKVRDSGAIPAAPQHAPHPDSNAGSHQSSGVASAKLGPNLHIDIQIHISPDSSAEQIDKIFESMSKHLKDFRI